MQIEENQPTGQPFQSGSNQYPEQLPYSVGVLVMGILSIVTCMCYGVVGLALGIISLVLSAKGLKLYNDNPSRYTIASYNNLKAGRICAIIGTSLSAVYVLFVLGYLIFVGTMLTALPWEEIMDNR